MPSENPQLTVTMQRVIVGTDWEQTKRTLLVSIVLFFIYALSNSLALTYRSLTFLWAVGIELIHFPFATWLSISLAPIFGFGSITLGWGAILIAGLATIASFHDCGYIPSLVLSAAPGAGYYLFNFPGPWEGGGFIRIHEGLVITPPTWAAIHLAPDVLVFGTVGFLLGIVLRRRYRHTATKSSSKLRHS